MFSLHHQGSRLCDGVTRREWLRIGGLSLMGLSLPQLLHARENLPLGVPPTDKTFGRAKNVIFLYLAGGPPQHETFDPKPQAPVEIRGPFKPISTNVPGIQFCELLPRTARIADKLAIIRSMSTDDNIHSSSGSWVLTGHKYQGANARSIQPNDWPYFGSIIKQQKPSEVLPPLSTVWIPDWVRLNENVTPAGQTGGLMGRQWDPDRFIGDPADPNYKVEGVRLTDIPPLRLKQRQSLLKQVDRHFAVLQRGRDAQMFDQLQQQAFDLLTSGRARDAFALDKEPAKLRDRYGRATWGQSLILARRLVEAGVRLVHVVWPREPGDNAVDNPLWDTHAQNADRVEDVLCPQLDVGLTALVEDLDERGLLDETLVVAIGEFGRTPKINAKGGRDHWGPVFSLALAGAGISGGQVYGASDKQGAYPALDRVDPGHLTATIYHLLGINWQGSFRDPEGREHRLTIREPIFPLLGIEPATLDRTEPGGDIARVPPYDKSLLLNVEFRASVPLYPLDTARPKGWRAAPLADGGAGLCVKLLEPTASGKRQVVVGYGFGPTSPPGQPIPIAQGAQAALAQEVRSPFAGTYRLKVNLRGEAVSREHFDEVLLKNFTFKLLMFEFTEAAKTPAHRKELASQTFVPQLAEPDADFFQTVELEKVFINPNPGQNFSFGLGMGVAVVVEKTSPGVLELPGDGRQQALVRIDNVALEFTGKPRNEDVRV